jgi:hypothetical protein
VYQVFVSQRTHDAVLLKAAVTGHAAVNLSVVEER